jgi:hypothetical protein
MGNCCAVKPDSDIVIDNLKKNNRSSQGRRQRGQDPIIDSILDERVVNGKSGDDKIEHIEKI